MTTFSRTLLAHIVSKALGTATTLVLKRAARARQAAARQELCHARAIGVLREWYTWSTENSFDIPSALGVKTMILIDQHGGMPDDGDAPAPKPEAQPEQKGEPADKEDQAHMDLL